jgi:Tfp pilus assembly protein PilF
MKEYDRSLYIIDHTIEKDPHHIDAYLMKGNIFRQKKQFDDALHYYKRALALQSQP